MLSSTRLFRGGLLQGSRKDRPEGLYVSLTTCVSEVDGRPMRQLLPFALNVAEELVLTVEGFSCLGPGGSGVGLGIGVPRRKSTSFPFSTDEVDPFLRFRLKLSIGASLAALTMRSQQRGEHCPRSENPRTQYRSLYGHPFLPSPLLYSEENSSKAFENRVIESRGQTVSGDRMIGNEAWVFSRLLYDESDLVR